MLQTRNGKRTGLAAVRIAVELNKERLIDQKTALLKRFLRIQSPHCSLQYLIQLPKRKQKTLATGLPAGPGAASGKVCFTADKAEAVAAAGEEQYYAEWKTTPEDLRGMIAADGILTSRGGVSSHAALVARQMNKDMCLRRLRCNY